MTIGCRWAWGLLAGAIALTVTGCTTVMSGAAVRDPRFSPNAVDPSLLNAGNYPVKPRPPLGLAGAADVGALLDAQHLADYVTGPWEVDPALITPIHFGAYPAAVAMLPGNITRVFVPNSDVNAAVARHGLINGFAAGRQVKGQRTLTNVVLRYPDPAAAAAVVAEAGHANSGMPDLPAKTLTDVPIPGHADAVGTFYTWDDPDLHATWTTVQSFTAHGPFVLFQRSEVVGPAEVGAALIGKTLDVQAPAIDMYKPVDPAQFPSLPKDPSGMLALALPVNKDNSNLVNNATYGVHGTLHFRYDPVAQAKVLGDVGLDVAVQTAGWVDRTRDAASAAVLLDSEVKTMQGPGANTDDAIPNFPGSHCQPDDDAHTSFSCAAAVGRYMFSVWGHTLKDAQQQAAAQYLILAAA